MSAQKTLNLYDFKLILFLVSGSLFSCAPKFSTDGNNNSVLPNKPEDPYCYTATSVTNGVRITGTAQYYYRSTSVTLGLTGSPVLGKVPYAEVVVKNSSGTTIQCSTTGANGELSLDIPKTAGTYTLWVNSRSDTSKLKVSILNDVNSNAYYSIGKIFSIGDADVAVNIGEVSAYARLAEDSELKGGAFHILWNIYRANEFLRNAGGNSSWVAEKVTVYWKAGFNPNTYLGGTEGLSYYSVGNRKLYILGGSNGDVKASDTDHFDDSVILHEYGHFLEDLYYTTESPGGSHTWQDIQDPRLNWSEGWGYFFSAAVMLNWNTTSNSYSANAGASRARYIIDTKGFSNDSEESNTSGAIIVYGDLNESGLSASNGTSVTQTGEGIFKELSVTRSLFKTIASSSQFTYGVDIPFSEVWTIFTNTSSGFASTSQLFKNTALFNSLMNTKIGTSYTGSSTKWNNLLTNEKQNLTPSDYANPVSSSGSACTAKTILPVIESGNCSTTSNTYSYSNLLRNNDFFVYYYDGTSTTITLNYSLASGKSSPADLDIYLFKKDYTYYEDCYANFGANPTSYGVAKISNGTYGSTESGTESISFTGLTAGYYLINVRAYVLGKTGVSSTGSTYTMTLTKTSGTTNLCPQY